MSEKTIIKQIHVHSLLFPIGFCLPSLKMAEAERWCEQCDSSSDNIKSQFFSVFVGNLSGFCVLLHLFPRFLSFNSKAVLVQGLHLYSTFHWRVI